mgnify:CR=1 FL=1
MCVQKTNVVKRSMERRVIASDGSAYYAADYYQSFTPIG